MRKFIICIVLCAINANMYSYAIPLDLTDVIKQARENEIKKHLSVKNTVKEIKEISKLQEVNRTELQNKQTETEKTISDSK